MEIQNKFNDIIKETLPLNIFLNNNIYYFRNRHYLFRYNRSIYIFNIHQLELIKLVCDIYNESGGLKQCLFLIHKMWSCYSFCSEFEIKYLFDLIYKNIKFKTPFESNIFNNSEECYMMRLKCIFILLIIYYSFKYK